MSRVAWILVILRERDWNCRLFHKQKRCNLHYTSNFCWHICEHDVSHQRDYVRNELHHTHICGCKIRLQLLNKRRKQFAFLLKLCVETIQNCWAEDVRLQTPGLLKCYASAHIIIDIVRILSRQGCSFLSSKNTGLTREMMTHFHDIHCSAWVCMILHWEECMWVYCRVLRCMFVDCHTCRCDIMIHDRPDCNFGL